MSKLYESINKAQEILIRKHKELKEEKEMNWVIYNKLINFYMLTEEELNYMKKLGIDIKLFKDFERVDE
jgi:hypothetical protein